MCLGGPKMPKAPDPPPPAPTPPPPAPMIEPQAPTPPPEMVKPETDAKVKKKRSSREQAQQVSRGTSALRIPLNIGGGKGKAKSGLNIPK